MAHNRDYKPEDIAFPEQIITQSELVSEMQTSYIEYAMSVIVGRALPDVRDGLKPVHRRILYAMYEDGLTSDKPFKKSATCVGDVLGRYHPHGDASVYDAMVRLAQDFSMRYMLVDGHGNFGSVDGDPPAAYRYTEARMSKIANEMLRDIDKDTVDWDPNFDESRKEPRVMPSRFPNLLVNGSSGIAVGMATNIPPHNLREVIGACICLEDNPDATLEELMQHIKGPDFPTRGIIMGRAGIREAYATGRGKIVVRARTNFEEFGHDRRTRIIVNELPYQVNKRQLIRTIADQVKDKRLDGITDLRDESDRNGMRIVIELRRDANAEVILNRLFTQTALQSSFSVIMLALTDNQRQPKVLTLKQVLEEYLAFQRQIIIRRTKFDLKKARDREHLLNGLLIAQDNIDKVIKIIRASYDDAKENLMNRFGLDDVQAQAILDMRLKALQGLDREKLEAEFRELEERIAHYMALLESEDMLRQTLKEELQAIADKYGDDRRTDIENVSGEVDVESLIPVEDCVVTLTDFGYVKRLTADTYRSQRRGGRGISGMTRREEDVADKMLVISSHDWLVFVTDTGRIFKSKCYEIPESGRNSKGMNIVNLLNLQENEKVVNMIRLPEELEGGEQMVFVTARGIMKRTAMTEFSNVRRSGLRAVSVDEGDRIVGADVSSGGDDFIVASREGMAIRFKETDVRSMGRTARGVRIMRLDEGDEIVGLEKVVGGKLLLTVTELGYGRRSDPDEYRLIKRGGKGVTNYKQTDKRGLVAAIRIVDEDEDIIMITDAGIVLRTPVTDISIQSRTAGGVTVMKVAEGTKVVTLAVTPHDDGEENADVTETQTPTDGEAEPTSQPENSDEGGTKTEE